MEFNPKEILNRLEKEPFEKLWEEYSSKIPVKSEIDILQKISNQKGTPSLIYDAICKIRKELLNLGFDEIINPIIIPEQEIFLQYGPEAPVILDRIYYLAGLPRPDIGLDSETIEKIKREIRNIDISKLKEILRKYREKEIEADDLLEIFEKELNISQTEAIKLINIFNKFFNLTPIPTKNTLRSHMTGAWFITLSNILKYKEPPLFLFSIDWVFRREQKEDESHLRYYHSCSIVIIDKDMSEDNAFKITKKILDAIQKALNIRFNNIEFIKRVDTARYYALNKEWEVYVDFGGKKYEIGTFGIYNPISLAKYNIKYPVYNFGIGLERILQVIYNIKDIRDLVFPYRKVEYSDEEIKKSLLILKPESEKYKNLLPILYKKVLEYKDKKGPFIEKIYEDDELEIFFIEKDKDKNFVGPATFNKIYIKDGNIISSIDNEKGVYVGDYLELILNKLLYLIEKENFEGIFSIKWVEGPSDVNIRIPPKILEWMHKNNKKINIKGPVFIDILIRRKNNYFQEDIDDILESPCIFCGRCLI